uniref:NADH dehydrogenase subunit 9 n=1 Tax=Prasinococcus sp. CCMP1194 TaxID=110672 RepID=A0A650AKK7_9VIRI|nr:NADH dehydrogenase subunit 9 [Prasinococcus sp. CCMP1194]
MTFASSQGSSGALSRAFAQDLQSHLAFSKVFQNTVSVESPLSDEDTFGLTSIPTFLVEKEVLVFFLFYLKNQTKYCFNFFTDLCVVDYPTESSRFEVVYHLGGLSPEDNLYRRLRVKVLVKENEILDSALSVYPGVSWFECEAWDMYGVFFQGNPDLRRILTDYGFEGYPLRKDFPLTGYTEVRFDEKTKRVVSEPVELAQEFREFSQTSSPWRKEVEKR